MNAQPVLRLVDTNTGDSIPFLDAEVTGLQREIDMLRTQLRKAEEDTNRWRWRHEELKRDKEAEAKKDALWPNAVRLFQLYCRLTGKIDKKTGKWKARRLTWNWERFEEVRPHLKKHGLAMCERAIVGRVYHHHSEQRPNGSTIHYYEWGRIFGNLGKGSAIENFEESANRAPLDFVSELEAEDHAKAEVAEAGQGTLA